MQRGFSCSSFYSPTAGISARKAPMSDGLLQIAKYHVLERREVCVPTIYVSVRGPEGRPFVLLMP